MFKYNSGPSLFNPYYDLVISFEVDPNLNEVLSSPSWNIRPANDSFGYLKLNKFEERY